MRHRIDQLTIPSAIAVVCIAVALSLVVARAGQDALPRPSSQIVGQTVTRLSDGRWLVVGGIGPNGPSNVIVIVEGGSAAAPNARIVGTLSDSRGWHAATVLADGLVLFTGGVGAGGKVLDTAETFDPANGLALPIPWLGTGRANHTATLLRDGRVLIAGGVTQNGDSMVAVDTFDPVTFELQRLDGELLAGRRNHAATLMPDGTVKFEGGIALPNVTAAEIYNPDAQRSLRVDRPVPDEEMARLAFASPANGATVSADVRVALQYTKPLAVSPLQRAAIRLQDEAGRGTNLRPVLAEGGLLLFLTPEQSLSPGQRYQLTVNGLLDASGHAAARVSLQFRVSDTQASADEPPEEWTPKLDGKWRADRPASPWQSLPPLRAAPGVTALSGQVLLMNGRPLADVTLKIGARTSSTDRSGRFLISGTAAGPHTLVIDGRSASAPGRAYGVFLSRTQLKESDTTVLPYTIWMPKIDTTHAVPIGPRLGADLVVRTPLIPGLELHIPKGSVIRDHEGRIANEISITPVPVDRTPFPLPTGIDVPVYFTIQPGGGFIETPGAAWPSGARVVYPNFTGHQPQTELQFWNYDPDDRGWHVYGRGVVDQAGAQIVPKPGTVIYRFTGTMINVPGMDPPADAPTGDGPRDGDPVDLGTGLFVLEKTDLSLADVMPLSLTRTYRPNDTAVRPFGIGATHPYAMFLWSAQQYQEADMILPDGGRIHYVRTSAGTGYTDAVFEHTTSPGPFYKSTLVWNGAGWDLRLKDGTVYVWGENRPLEAIRDRHGNTIRIDHSGGTYGNNVSKVTSPNGRFIEFTYDGSNRITQVKDNIGRTVGYQYDASGRLWKVTDTAAVSPSTRMTPLIGCSRSKTRGGLLISRISTTRTAGSVSKRKPITLRTSSRTRWMAPEK